MLGIFERLEQSLAGRYEIEHELGHGGMATVYAARDLRHRRQVAIKVLRPELAIGIAAERFRSEIEIAAALTHPNILPVFDSGGSGDCLYYVMPRVEGESLRARLERDKRIPLEDAIRITRDVAGALAYAHSRNIVHRDIKPENILFVEGHAVVTDFGIARAVEQATSHRLTVTGLAVGTPLYMSPEQASGDPNVDLRSDIYSLACVLYEMLGGSPPHPGETPQQVLASKLTETPRPLHSSGADVPSSIDSVIEKALASQAEERYSSATEFAEALTTASTSTRTLWRLSRKKRTRMSRSGGIALVTAIAAIAGAGAIATWRRAPAPIHNDDGRIGVAVLPFKANDPNAARWTEAIPDLLATALDGTPGVRVADPWSVWRQLRSNSQSPARSPSPEEAADIAKRASACCFILGSVTEFPNQVDVSVKIYRRGEKQPWQTFHKAAPSDSLASLVQGLAIAIIEQLSAGSSAVAAARLSRGLTRSPDALKAWLQAREAHRRGQHDSADAAITRAISLDSNFVLALIDAGTIRSWSQFSRGQVFTGMREIADRAVRLSDSLGDRPRLRARALLASINTQGLRAASALEAIVGLDSMDVDAWSMLSYVHTVYGWQYGRTARDALAASERAVLLDSTDVPALVRRLYLAVAENDAADVEVQLRRLRRADTSSAIVRGMIASVEGLRADDAQFSILADRIAASSQVAWIAAYRMLRNFRPERTAILLERTRRSASAALLGIAAMASAQDAITEGRWAAIDSMRSAGTTASTLDFDRSIDRDIAGAMIAGAGDEERARRAVAKLATGFPPDSALAFFRTRWVWLDGWVIGAYNAMYGDTLLAKRWADALGALPVGGSPREYGAALQADVQARLASRRGDLTTALTLARRAYDRWTIHTENVQEFMPEPAIRFHLASLQRSAGFTDSAATLFRSLIAPTTWMAYYTTRSSLELAELEEQKGDRAAAQRDVLTSLVYWERGDTSMASLRDRARRLASRLGENLPRSRRF